MKALDKLTDHRRTDKGNVRFSLSEIIFVSLAAILCAANDWETVETFGKEQIDWLRKFFPYRYGTPSHDTLERFFAKIDPEAFNLCLMDWVQNLQQNIDNKHIIIDGKRICGSYDDANEKNAFHVVSAFASELRMCLGQVICNDKSNEITAIPQMLNLLTVTHSVITIDAIGCQRDIASQIKAKGGEYILAVKGNQPTLFQDIKDTFNRNAVDSSCQELDMGHGRIEQRTCSVIRDLRFLDTIDQWTGIKSIVKVERVSTDKNTGDVTTGIRYYISSNEFDAQGHSRYIRHHWRIENQLHWVLDVVFAEDDSRRRKGQSAANFSLISKCVMAMLSQKQQKKSKRQMRFQAAFSQDVREYILKS